MLVEKMPLMIRQIRLFLLAMGTLPAGGRRGAVVALPSPHHLLVARRSSMQNRLAGGGEIHRAKGAEIGRGPIRRLVADHRLAAIFRHLGRVARQLMALKRHQRPDRPRAQVAPHPLLVLVARRQTHLVARLLRVHAKLQIVTEAAIATGAGQGSLTADHHRHRAPHHRDHVSVARIEQMGLHSFVLLAPKVARGASVAAAYLNKNRGVDIYFSVIILAHRFFKSVKSAESVFRHFSSSFSFCREVNSVQLFSRLEKKKGGEIWGIPARGFSREARTANGAGTFPPCCNKSGRRNTGRGTAEPHSPYFPVKSDALVAREDLRPPRGSDNERANACPFAPFSPARGTSRRKVSPSPVCGNFS